MCEKVEQYNQISHLPQMVADFVAGQPGVARVLLALSGGLDSTVLVHAAARARLTQPLLALHVNHGLSANAGSWQQHCEALCRSLEIPLICEAVKVERAGEGLEQAARAARYKAIEKHLRPGDWVLMAHHQMDQVETFFLRLARGSGPAGLGAMAQVRAWGPAHLGRPFLTLDRRQLLAYAQAHGLSWVEDESNQDTAYDRNFLRSQILPLMQQRWPALPAQVVRAADLCRESEDLLAAYAAQDLQICRPQRERLGESLLAEPLLEWPAPRRHLVIRHWLQTMGFRSPGQVQLAQLHSLLTAAADRNPLLDWGDCELRRFGERIYCLPAGWNRELFDPVNKVLTGGERWDLGDGFRMDVSAGEHGLMPGEYRLVPRCACPEIKRGHPASRQHSQTMKNLLQEYRLEPWLRDRVPLLMAGDQLAAVGDLWVERGFFQSDTQGLRLNWKWTGAQCFD